MRLKVKRTRSGNVFINRQKARPFKYREGRRCVGTIFLVGDVFVKIGARRESEERAVYDRARRDGVEHYLAPLVKAGRDWNAFKRVDGEEVSVNELDDDQIEVLNWLQDTMGYYDHCCEGNFVVRDDGSVVIIDCEA